MGSDPQRSDTGNGEHAPHTGRSWRAAWLLVMMGRFQYAMARLLTGLLRWSGGQGHDVDDLRYLSGLFREPELFAAMPEYLQRRFPQGARIYCYASASGAEPYSMAMTVLTRLTPEQAATYLPIQARELNPALVDFCQQQGILYLAADDLEDYRRAGLRVPVRRFLIRDRSHAKSLRQPARYVVRPELRRQVVFEVGDLLADVPTLASPDGRPLVLWFRNSWYHIHSPSHVLAFCKSLFQALPSGSAVIVGAVYLEKHGYSRLLQAAGFVRAGDTPPWMQIHEKP